MKNQENKTNRQRIREVFQGSRSDLPPVSIRMDLWYRHANATGILPGEIHDMSVESVEDFLGFCRSARYHPRMVLHFGGEIYKLTEGPAGFVEEYHLPNCKLTRRVHETEEMHQAGMRGHIAEYPLKDRRDVEAFMKALSHARMEIETGDFGAFDRAVGNKGDPLCVLGVSPAHHLMLSWIGYENFYFLQADFPDLIDATIQILEEVYMRDMWPKAGDVAAELLLHGAHFSESLTPRPIFRKYFLPYFERFNRSMHERGKKVLFHSDADLGNLIPLVLEAGFDGADCLATKPLVDETLGDYLKAWGEKIVCWGGLPSTLFAPSCPIKQFCAYVDELKQVSRGMSCIIIGASDNVMPGTEWEKLLYVQEVFETKA